MKDALREKLKSVKKKVLPTVGPDEVLEVDTDQDGKAGEDSLRPMANAAMYQLQTRRGLF